MENNVEVKTEVDAVPESKGLLSSSNNKSFIIKLCSFVLVLSVLGIGFIYLKNTVFKKDVVWSLSEDGVLTISGKGAIEDIDPLKQGEWLEGDGYKNIKKIIIKDGITHIGDYAFYKCSKATQVVLPKTLKSVGDFSFMGCTQITQFVFNNGLESLGEGALYGCTGAKVISLPDSVTSVGFDALYGTGYYSAENNWSGGGLYLGSCLLDVRKSVVGEFSVKDGTKVIADRAFLDCTGLESAVLSDSVLYLGGYAFSGCTGLESVTFGKDLAAISEGLFWNCTALKEVLVSDNWAELLRSAGADWDHGTDKVTYR